MATHRRGQPVKVELYTTIPLHYRCTHLMLLFVQLYVLQF